MNVPANVNPSYRKDGLTCDSAGISDADEYSDMLESSSFLGQAREVKIGSYVPPGYIVLDHSNKNSDYHNLSSVGSL